MPEPRMITDDSRTTRRAGTAVRAGLRLAVMLLLGASCEDAQPAPRATTTTAKKLIEVGWDEPDPRFMREHIAELQRTPFDGCVFHLSYRGTDGKDSNYTWQVWGRRAFPDSLVQHGLDDLRATRFGRFRHNFLRINVVPADLDWFDDHRAVLHNVALAARVARAGGCAGLFLDTEAYEAQLWWYEKQRDTTKHGWNGYAAQVRRRGREVIEAMQEEFPDLTLFLSYGYSLTWLQHTGGQGELRACAAGLLAPFMDGLFAGARGRTKIVDGHELSYAYRDTAAFARAYRRVRSELTPIVADTAAYARHLSVGFGLWIDYDWRAFGWDTLAHERNFFTPAAFEASQRAALRAADEYVWIYTEMPRWWTTDRRSVRLPAAYEAAVRRGRR